MPLFALDETKLQIIFKATALGMPRTRAGAMANISSNAFQRYLVRGQALADKIDKGVIDATSVEGEDRLCLLLVLGIEHSKAQGVQNWLETVNQAGSSDWRSHAWLLDRLGGPEFQKQTREIVESTNVQANVSLEDVLTLRQQVQSWEQAQFGSDDVEAEKS
jgi:hypothetical protein